MIYCEDCGWVPGEGRKSAVVLLPADVEFTGKGVFPSDHQQGELPEAVCPEMQVRETRDGHHDTFLTPPGIFWRYADARK